MVNRPNAVSTQNAYAEEFSVLCVRSTIPLALGESYVRTQFFLNPSTTGCTTQNAYAQKVFVAVTANSHDGLARTERLLPHEMFTSLSRTALDNRITERIAPVFACRSLPRTADC